MKASKYKSYYCWIMMAALAGGAAAFVASSVLLILAAPYQFDFGEGLVWWQSVHITDPELAYKPISRYPYMVFHYPPAYHLAANAAARAIGDWLAGARLLSLLSTLGTGAALGALVFRSLPAGARPVYRCAAAMFAGAIGFSLQPMVWARFARVDMLALFFAYAGLCVYVSSKKALSGQLAAFLLFVLALFTKPTVWPAMLACLIVGAVLHFRRALGLGIFAAVCGGALVGYMSAVTHGGFLLNVVVYNVNPFSMVSALHQIQIHLGLVFGVAALGCAEAVTLWRSCLRRGRGAALRRVRAALERSSYHRAGLTLSFALVFEAIQSVGIGKTGANFNYFLGMDLACCALSGLLLFRVLASIGVDRRAEGAAWAVCLLALFLAMPTPVQTDALFKRLTGRPVIEPQQREAFERFTEKIRSTPGRVYAEDINLLMRAGKEVPAEAGSITALSRNGVWDERPFLEQIRNRQFALIVVEDLYRAERYTESVRRAIETSYVASESSGKYKLYRKR